MINIVYLVTRLSSGKGPINQAFNLATGFKRLEANFTIVCLSPENPEKSVEKKFLDAGVNVVHLHGSMYDFFGLTKELKKYVKEHHIDIVHSSGLRPDIVNIMLGDCVKHVTTMRSEPLNAGETHNKVVGKLMASLWVWCIRKMDKVIACSESLESVLKNQHHVECEAVQNAVDIDYFVPSTAEEKIQLREKLGLPVDRTIILYLGVLIPRKNIDYLVSAYKTSGCSCLLVLIGDHDGIYESKYKAMNDENVLFLGQKSSLEYLKCADYSISASLSEGLPNSVLESLACGVPVILSDIEPHKEIMKYGDFGAIFNVSTEENLHEALDVVLKKNHDTLVENCIGIANGHFSKYCCAKNYLSKYNELLN